MYDIITFGSASMDIFVKPEKFKIVKSKKDFVSGKGVCFNFGSKVDIEEINFFSGGAGTNTAATFVKQGFDTAFFGSVGDDLAGEEIIEEIKNLGVDAQFVKKTKEKPTNHSIVIEGLKDDRTILVYKGASEFFKRNDISWQEAKEAKWVYLAPLSGSLCDIFEPVVNFAKENNIKVAANPGNCQLAMPEEILKRIIEKVDVLILNQEEASLLTKMPFKKEKQIFKKIDEMCPGIAIMTKGKNGAVVSDGKELYKAKALKTEVVDTTGAGDAFGSGFVAEFIRSNGDIERSIQFGMANSAGCLTKVGAKNGLLEKNSEFVRVPVAKEKCGKNNLCITK